MDDVGDAAGVDGHAAETWFRQLRSRSDADRRVVFEALVERERRAALGAPPEDVAHALAACAADLGVEAPSASEYTAWQRSHPAAPTASRIRRQCGSWKGAKVLLGFPAVDPRPARRAPTRRFSATEELEALRAYIESLAAGVVPTKLGYRRFAAAQSRAGDRRKAVPRSPTSVVRRHGGWPEALAAAGYHGPTGAPVGPRPPARFGRLNPDEALREAHAALGKDITPYRYDHWVKERDREIAAGAQFAAAPFSRRIIEAYDGWGNALSVGLGDDLALACTTSRAYTRDELESAYRACAEELDHPPTQCAYNAWRRARLEKDPQAHLPSSVTLTRSLGRGTWSGVAATSGRAVPALQRERRGWSDHEIHGAWVRCCRERGLIPSFTDYRAWQWRVQRNGVRVPGPQTVQRRLGAKAWADLPNPDGLPDRRESDHARSGRGIASANVLGAAVACTTELRHRPSISEFTTWRHARVAAGESVPTWVTVARRLGGGRWLAVHDELTARGLVPPANAGYSRYRYRGSDAQMLAIYLRCREDLGGHMSIEQYTRWRDRHHALDAKPLPSSTTLARRLGHGLWARLAAMAADTTACSDT